jgi:tetratricopeptide (TPR) repeat protein
MVTQLCPIGPANVIAGVRLPNCHGAEDYLLVVETDHGQSSQLDAAAFKTGFRRASDQSLDSVNGELQSLPIEEMSSGAAMFFQADIYKQQELFGQSIETLESLLEQFSDSVSAYLELGEIYSLVGLNQLAEQRLLQARRSQLMAP